MTEPDTREHFIQFAYSTYICTFDHPNLKKKIKRKIPFTLRKKIFRFIILSVIPYKSIVLYILSGAEKPSKSMHVSNTSLVNMSSAIHPDFFCASSSVRIFVS